MSRFILISGCECVLQERSDPVWEFVCNYISAYMLVGGYVYICSWVSLHPQMGRTKDSSVLPGSRFEPSTPAPWTHSRFASLHTVHPPGTAARKRKERVQSIRLTMLHVTDLPSHFRTRALVRCLGLGHHCPSS